MNRTLRDAIELASDYPEHPAAARILAATGKKKRGAKAVNGETTRAEDRAAEKRDQRANDALLRTQVLFRSKGLCEACLIQGYEEHGHELDHFAGGSGRRRQHQSLQNTWWLCKHSHDCRTRNAPSVAHWNRLFKEHCEKYGYPVIQHIEHAPLLPRKERVQ